MSLEKKHKAWIGFGVAGFIAVCLALFYFANLYPIKAGFEGVMVHRPYMFGDEGVDLDEVLSTGRPFVWPSTEVVQYNIKPYTFTESFEDITASDNVAIDFSVSLIFENIKGKTPALHKNFGKDWYQQKATKTAQTIIRNECRIKSSIALRTDEIEITNSQSSIMEKIQMYLEVEKIPVRLTQVVIGKVVPPDEVLKEAAKTAAEKQREKTQDARAKAELNRKQAETNKALADKAYASEMGMTSQEYLQRLLLDILEEAEKDGKIDFNVYMMGGAQPQPVFQVGK